MTDKMERQRVKKVTTKRGVRRGGRHARRNGRVGEKKRGSEREESNLDEEEKERMKKK